MSKLFRLIVILGLLLGAVAVPANAAAQGPDQQNVETPDQECPKPPAQAIFFAADGMRPDLMERYAAEGRHVNVRRSHAKGRAR